MQHLGEPIHIHQVEGTDWILTPEYIVYDWREPRLQEENPGRRVQEKHVQMCFFEAYRYKTKSTRNTETM